MVTSIYDQWGTDEKVEQEGVLLDYGEAGSIRVRRAGGSNKAYQKRLEKFARKYRRQIELGVLSEEVANRELVQIFADTVVLGGEVIGKDGKKISLSNRQNVVKLFTELPDLFRDVRDQTGSIEAFRVLEREDDAKN